MRLWLLHLNLGVWRGRLVISNTSTVCGGSRTQFDAVEREREYSEAAARLEAGPFEIPVGARSRPDACYDAGEGGKTPPLA
jgi:hypothetical protein